MVEVEDRIAAAGAEIIWVLEQDVTGEDGTAELCTDFMTEAGSQRGWCVGDGQTEPTAGAFDDSPFAAGRGFDIAMRRAEMRIEFVTDHGTPSGNENLDAIEIAEAVEALAE